MQPAQHASIVLSRHVRRFDWQQNIYAPDLHILQALTHRGETASGAGSSRALAHTRCLAEVAEFHALYAAGGAETLGFRSHQDGVAAHPDAATARTAARLEAFERHCVALWWHGQLPARPLDPDWLEATGVAGCIAEDRRGAAQRRPSALWRVEVDGDIHLMICRSSTLRGQLPVLGFGCHGCAAWAALKALREVMLMELNVMTVQIARRNGELAQVLPIRDMIDSCARHTPRLLTKRDPVVPPRDVDSPAVPGWFSSGLEIRDISALEGSMPVWLCLSAHSLPTSAGSVYTRMTHQQQGAIQ
jgi:ribosomal protein S12 methylthiotransferase accessory factor YcaO